MRRLTALLILSCLFACSGEGVRPSAVVQAPDSADQVLLGFQHYVTRDGLRRSRIEADTALFYDPSQRATLKRARVTFYDAGGAETSTLAAQRVEYDWQTNALRADGAVELRTPAGWTLQTEQLHYDEKANQISTTSRFTFQRGAERLEGTSFRSDLDFRNVVTSQPRGSSGKSILLPGQ